MFPLLSAAENGGVRARDASQMFSKGREMFLKILHVSCTNRFSEGLEIVFQMAYKPTFVISNKNARL